MFSVLDVVFFAPKLFFSLLAGTTDTCLNLAKSCYTCLASVVDVASSAVSEAWSYIFEVAVGAFQALTQSCSKRWWWLPSVIKKSVVSVADTIDHFLQSMKPLSSRLKTGRRSWITCFLCRTGLPWMTPTFWAQRYSKLMSWCRHLPSRARASVYKACVSISKGSAQLLWNCSFALCTSVHAWLVFLLADPESPLDSQVLLLPLLMNRQDPECWCTCLYLKASVWTCYPALHSGATTDFLQCMCHCYQVYRLLLQALIAAPPDIGNVLTTTDSNKGDSVHSEGGGPLNKPQPSGSPVSVLDSTDLQTDFHPASNSISVPQVCSLVFFMVMHAASLTCNLARNRLCQDFGCFRQISHF